MPKNKISFNFKEFEELAEKLDELGSDKLLKKGVEAGLKASKQYVNQQVSKAIQKSNLPAKGHYSTGETEKSLDKNFNIEWNGMIASTNIGFKFSESGPKSIFLMYGTPRHKPPMAAVPGLYDAIYGKKTKSKVKKLQKEAIQKVISRVMEG